MVVFHRGLLGGSFAGMGQGGGILGTGEFGQWTCSNCGKPDCWRTRKSCHRCGCLRYLDAAGAGQVHSGGHGKGGGVAGFQAQGVGGGMSGVRLVGALGRDQTYVSTGNPTYRKGNGRRGGAREGPVPGAGVGPGSGGNRVRLQEILEKDGVPAGNSGVGVEAPGTAQMGQGKTQREMIFEAVEALRSLLGQGVGSQVVDMIQEHIPPPPKVTLPISLPPHSPTESERAQHLAKLLEDKAKLEKSIQRERRKRSARQGWRCLRQRMICQFLQQEMRGLSFQIDAHHREDDARRKVGVMI